MIGNDFYLTRDEIINAGGMDNYSHRGAVSPNELSDFELKYKVKLPKAWRQIMGIQNGGHPRARYYFNGDEEYEFSNINSMQTEKIKLPEFVSLIEYANYATDAEEMIAKCKEHFSGDLNKVIIFGSVYDDCVYVMDLNYEKAPVFMVIWTNMMGKIPIADSFDALIIGLYAKSREG